ncbi:MAG: tyrosine-type recombinase/integrase [Armatimonadia bacterium]
MGLQAAVSEYLDYLQTVARRSPLTVQGYRADYKRFLAFIGDQADLPLANVTPQLLERYTASLRDLSDATVRRALNALSSLFRWACRAGHASTNPVDLVQRPRKKQKIQPCPSPDEVSALLDATKGPTERAALLAMATSGLRRAELLGLDWSAVNLPARRLRIIGKGDKQREVAVFEELLAALHALHAKAGFPTEGPVFCGRLGKPLQQSALQAWLNKWLEATGLRDTTGNRYTLHSLRRFAAKRWLEGGLNIRQVQLLLGHSDLQVTMQYLCYDFEEVQRQAARVDFGLTLKPVLER